MITLFEIICVASADRTPRLSQSVEAQIPTHNPKFDSAYSRLDVTLRERLKFSLQRHGLKSRQC